MQTSLINDAGVDNYIKQLDCVESKIQFYETKTKDRQNKEFQVLQKLEWIEEQLKKDL